VKFWRNPTNGGEGYEGKENEKFLTLHIFPIRGDGGTRILLADGALPDPCTSKISDPKILREMGRNV